MTNSGAAENGRVQEAHHGKMALQDNHRLPYSAQSRGHFVHLLQTALKSVHLSACEFAWRPEDHSFLAS